MELHEVKIGDLVSYKDKFKRMIKGKVVHRFEGDDKPHLSGHVNVQKIDGSSYPKTIHVSNLTPCFEEGTSMEFSSLKEDIAAMLADLRNGANVAATEKFNDILSAKVDEVVMNAKVEVANALFNSESVDEEFIDDAEEIEYLTQEEFDALSDEEKAEFEAIELDADQVDEALIGGQKKIDANKNGKLDAHDFKLLRAKKGMKEEAHQIDELSKKTLGSYIRKAGNDSRDSSFELGQYDGGLTSTYAKKAIKLRKDSVAKRTKGISAAVSKLTKEAYSDPYAAKKAAEMKKTHSEKIKGIKKEFDADKSLPNPFMKLKKDDPRNRFEEVELMDEGNAENKAKKNAFVRTLSKKGYTNMLKKGRDTLKGDPYVIKHRNKMKAALYGKESAAFDKEIKAQKAKQNEEVKLMDEGNAENKAKKNSYVSAKGTAYVRKNNADVLADMSSSGQSKKSMSNPSPEATKSIGRHLTRYPVSASNTGRKLTRYPVAEEVEPVNEKLVDTAKRVIKSALAHNMPKDAKKTSAQARAMIKIAKMNPANTVRKEDVELEEGHFDNKPSQGAKPEPAKGKSLRDKLSDPEFREKYKKDMNKMYGIKEPKNEETLHKEYIELEENEGVDLQELDADTLRSYISKRHKPNLRDKANGPTYMHNGPGGDPVAQKQIKGIDNAHKSLTKKYASKLKAASDNAAAASYRDAKPGTYHGD